MSREGTALVTMLDYSQPGQAVVKLRSAAPPEPLHVVELFSGLGGWRIASDFLGWETVLAVDANPEVTQAYAESFEEGRSTTAGLDAEGSVALTNMIQDISTLRKLGNIEVDVVLWSAPCPSWSKAGQCAGLHAADGRAFVEALRVIRVLQPTWTCSENCKRHPGALRNSS